MITISYDNGDINLPNLIDFQRGARSITENKGFEGADVVECPEITWLTRIFLGSLGIPDWSRDISPCDRSTAKTHFCKPGLCLRLFNDPFQQSHKQSVGSKTPIPLKSLTKYPFQPGVSNQVALKFACERIDVVVCRSGG